MAEKKDRFDGYEVVMFLDEDGDWVAYLAEMPGVSAFAATPEKALKELEIAWGAVKEDCAAEGKPLPVAPARRDYGGVFQVRVDRPVRRALAIEPERAGLSLNALVAQKLAKAVEEI